MTDTVRQEERVRVIFHLPCGKDTEEQALYDVFTYLKSQLHASIPVTGFNHGSIRPPACFGYWYGRMSEESADEWIPDKIVQVEVDYPLFFADPRLSELMKDLHAALAKAYRDNGCKQAEFWITASPIFIQKVAE